ncbi:MAG TPA: FAD-dependent oxidoreductase [Cytophagaceae bacterium]|nr:FAD-dependent oxidoreductase [Cytophagaceae bacterium]
MKTDYLIVGQGIAGTVLGYTLLKKGCNVIVLSNEYPHQASLVAAGLYNPVTGKRMSKTWKAEILFPFMESFYKEFEDDFNCSILFPKPIYKPFSTIAEQNTWLSEHEGEAFVETDIPADKYSEFLHSSNGGFETNHSGHLDIPTMLKAFREKLLETKCFVEKKFQPDKLIMKEDGVEYDGIAAKKIILCEGMLATTNPLFSWLPFVPSKGEVLKVKIKAFTQEVIFNKQVFIIPLEESVFRVGSTYHWEYESSEPTEQGRKELCEKLEQMIKMPFEILEHKAGIRPSVRDRKPIIGFHPENKFIGIFNGLGTKGVSLAPFFADAFAELLLNNKQLDPEVNIERFYSLYSRSEK